MIDDDDDVEGRDLYVPQLEFRANVKYAVVTGRRAKADNPEDVLFFKILN